MEIRLLEYFVTVCQELSFTKAADVLNISQPTLSREIRKLESNLGTQLFDRIGKKIYITPTGEVLLRHAKQIFSEIEQAKTTIKEMENALLGKFKIGNAGNFDVFKAVTNFHKEHPNIEITLLEVTTHDNIQIILNNQADLGIGCMPVHDPRLEFLPLMREGISLIFTEENELAKETAVTLDTLSSLPYYLLTKNFYIRQYVDNVLLQYGIEIKPKMEFSDKIMLLRTMILNKGVTFAYNSHLKAYEMRKFKHLTLSHIIPDLEMGLIYRKDLRMTPVLNTFVKFLLDYFKSISLKEKLA